MISDLRFEKSSVFNSLPLWTATLYDTLILAIVQGIAEFLPISSSGHLVILGALLNHLNGQTPSTSPTMEIILHAGTLGSILLIFWKRILALISDDRRVIPLLIIGTIPAATFGLILKSQFESLLKNPVLAGAMLLVTGVFLIVLGRLPQGDREYRGMSWLGAILVGCFQAFAILPGISRSGSTILGGRLLGLKTDDAVTFSFLLAIPAIAGATILELKDVIGQDSQNAEYGLLELGTGAFVSFLVGIVALKWLIGWSRQERLHWFAAWCIPVGVIALAFAL